MIKLWKVSLALAAVASAVPVKEKRKVTVGALDGILMLNSEDTFAVALERREFLMVMFKTAECGHACVPLIRLREASKKLKVSGKPDGPRFAMIDADTLPNIPRKFGIEAVNASKSPAYLVFKNGAHAATYSGSSYPDEILHFLDSFERWGRIPAEQRAVLRKRLLVVRLHLPPGKLQDNVDIVFVGTAVLGLLIFWAMMPRLWRSKPHPTRECSAQTPEGASAPAKEETAPAGDTDPMAGASSTNRRRREASPGARGPNDPQGKDDAGGKGLDNVDGE